MHSPHKKVLITGAMKAGKTSYLLKVMNTYDNCITVKCVWDTRNPGVIKSRDGSSWPLDYELKHHGFGADADRLKEAIGSFNNHGVPAEKTSAVFIDEGHMFNPLFLVEIAKECELANIDIYIAMLKRKICGVLSHPYLMLCKSHFSEKHIPSKCDTEYCQNSAEHAYCPLVDPGHTGLLLTESSERVYNSYCMECFVRIKHF